LSEAHIDVVGRHVNVVDAALAVLTGGGIAQISVLFEVAVWLITPQRLELGYHLIALCCLSLSLLKTFGLVETVYFMRYFLGLDLA